MRGIPRPSPAMVVAVIALIVAIGGTAVALPGKFTVGKDDLRKSSVGARALGRMIVNYSQGLRSTDPVAEDQVFTEMRGTIRCPSKAPFAFDPSVNGMSLQAFEVRRTALTNRWGSPRGYEFVVSSDQGPDVGYTMKINCMPAR